MKQATLNFSSAHSGPLAFDKSRGAQANYLHRFSELQSVPLEQQSFAEATPTTLHPEQCRSIISTNQSPDVPFDYSINPYRGCEHGCIYCFARPSHAYWDYSPGLDFETQIIYKENAVEQLRKTLSKPGYQCKPIALGVNTDAYQPAEESLQLTRQLLEVLLEYKHPVSLLTKSKLILRDLDILQELHKHGLVSVGVSITTLDNRLKAAMEPRTASPKARLKVMHTLVENNIPVSALLAPVIPGINDGEIESIVKAVKSQGVNQIQYIMLRLPHELTDIFSDWLEQHYPYRKEKVLNYIRDLRGGKLNSNQFNNRMSGEGIFAKIFKSRFNLACKKNGMNTRDHQSLNTKLFDNRLPSQLRLI